MFHNIPHSQQLGLGNVNLKTRKHIQSEKNKVLKETKGDKV